VRVAPVSPPSALSGVSPTRGEIGWSAGLAPRVLTRQKPHSGAAVECRRNHAPISPPVGEMPDRAEGGEPRTLTGLWARNV
jgi:hypothetical protein